MPSNWQFFKHNKQPSATDENGDESYLVGSTNSMLELMAAISLHRVIRQVRQVNAALRFFWLVLINCLIFAVSTAQNSDTMLPANNQIHLASGAVEQSSGRDALILIR